MNSLTTVGGTVIDEEEVNENANGGSRYSRGQQTMRGRGRMPMNQDVRRVRTFDDGHHAAADSMDAVDEPIPSASARRSSPRNAMPQAALSRHRSTPFSGGRKVAGIEVGDSNQQFGSFPPPRHPEHATPSPTARRSPSPSHARFMTSSTVPASETRGDHMIEESLSIRTRSMDGFDDEGKGKQYHFSSDHIDASKGVSMAASRSATPSTTSLSSIHSSSPRAYRGDGNGLPDSGVMTSATPRVITPSTSYHVNNILSPQAMLAKQSIFSTLITVSKSEPYVSSAYFQRIFGQGLENLERYNGEEGELQSIDDALRVCFDISEDMVHVIAAAGMAVEMESRQREAAAAERSDERNYGRMETDHHQRAMKPWEVPSKFSAPANLSGYTHKSTTTKRHHHGQESMNVTALPPQSPPPQDVYHSNDTRYYGGVKTPNSSIPSHALSLPLPPTPATPGKDSFPSTDELSQHDNAMMHNVYHLPTTGTSYQSQAAMTQEDVDASMRKEKARARVQQYLNQIDSRIKNVKLGSHRPQLMKKRVQSSSVVQSNIGGVMGGERAVRPWDSFDYGMRVAETPHSHESPPAKMKKQILLPSLLSPDENGNDTNAAWEEAQGSVFRANNAVDEAARAERETGYMPMDEATDEMRGRNVRQGTDCNHRPRLVLPPNNSATSDSDAQGEQMVRAVEKSVGLKSLQEYKQLLKERTLEMEGLEHRLEKTESSLGLRTEEVRQFRIAMKEAERAVMALEDTIQQLEEASHEKDTLISQLESRVKVLETELEQNTANRLEKEIEHQEMVKMLNESIAQMGGNVKEKDALVNELQAKTKELEDELEKAQKAIERKDSRLQASEQELTSTKEMLQTQMELYKNEIACSVENTSKLMDLMSKEKDSLIESLQAKIAVLEQSLQDIEEEKEQGASKHMGKEKELSEKIQTLALALTEKDKAIGALQEEQREMKVAAEAEKVAAEKAAIAKAAAEAEAASRLIQKSASTQTRSARSSWSSSSERKDNRRKKARESARQERLDHTRATTSKGRSHHSSKHHHERERQQRRERHQRGDWHGKKHRHLNHRNHHQRVVTPEGYYSEGHYEPQEKDAIARERHQYLDRRYYDDARDDDDLVMYDEAVMEGVMSRRHPVMYYTTSAEDSIFD